MAVFQEISGKPHLGGVAQLGERTVRIRKVESSILFVSTKVEKDIFPAFGQVLEPLLRFCGTPAEKCPFLCSITVKCSIVWETPVSPTEQARLFSKPPQATAEDQRGNSELFCGTQSERGLFSYKKSKFNFVDLLIRIPL